MVAAPGLPHLSRWEKNSPPEYSQKNHNYYLVETLLSFDSFRAQWFIYDNPNAEGYDLLPAFPSCCHKDNNSSSFLN
jgi:hypothetical protein